MSSVPASPVRSELIESLRCPACASGGEAGARLTGWDGAADDGTLACSACAARYPVRAGVPCLLPPALEAAPEAAGGTDAEAAEMRQEMRARDAQVRSYDRMLGLKAFTAAELPLSLRYLRPEPSHLILEGGCGTGRMTRAFARAGRGLLALDFSLESIRAAQSKLSGDEAARVLFVQGDLSRLPLASAAFDRVGSFGVYEHVPTPAARARALGEMARALKGRDAGGRFALSAYRWGPPQSLFSEREGHHGGGIYFRRFTADELRAQVEAAPFAVGGLTEALLYYHLLWALPRR